MAGTPFTSVISGLWNDGATFGNTSPGVKGTDWPGTAGDVVTIAAGHVVKYNVVETNELGAVTVNGTLWFPLDQSTKMTFGQVEFTIGATGVLITSSDGTVGNIGVVDDAFTCDFIWNTTGDNNKGMTITNGAYVDMRGDSALYGGTHTTTLATNWTSGQTLTATGTAPLSWLPGQTFTIARNTSYGSTTTLKFTIAGIVANGGNTDITISEAAPGIAFYAGGPIINEVRNVKFYKLGAEAPAIDTVYTVRPRIADNHLTGTIKWTDVQMTGIYNYVGLSSTTVGAIFTNCIMRNAFYGFNGIYFAVYTACNIYSNNIGFVASVYCIFANCYIFASSSRGLSNIQFCTFEGCHIYSNSGYGFYPCYFSRLANCNLFSNSYAINDGKNIRLYNCNIFSNYRPFLVVQECLMKDGSIGWNGLVSAPNISADIAYPCSIVLRNVLLPEAGLIFLYGNQTLRRGFVSCDEYNQTQAWRTYCGHGTITRVASPADFVFLTGCQKVEPLSLCSVTDPVYFMGGEKEIPLEGMPFYLLSGKTQVKVRVQASGFSILPTNAELYFEVMYYADATTTLTTATSTTVVDANDTTKEFTITVAPNRSDKTFIRGVLKKYEAGAYVLCDMIPICS